MFKLLNACINNTWNCIGNTLVCAALNVTFKSDQHGVNGGNAFMINIFIRFQNDVLFLGRNCRSSSHSDQCRPRPWLVLY